MERGTLVPVAARTRVWDDPAPTSVAERVKKSLEIVQGDKPEDGPDDLDVRQGNRRCSTP